VTAWLPWVWWRARRFDAHVERALRIVADRSTHPAGTRQRPTLRVIR
jgi:hypothetical protein